MGSHSHALFSNAVIFESRVEKYFQTPGHRCKIKICVISDNSLLFHYNNRRNVLAP